MDDMDTSPFGAEFSEAFKAHQIATVAGQIGEMVAESGDTSSESLRERLPAKLEEMIERGRDGVEDMPVPQEWKDQAEDWFRSEFTSIFEDVLAQAQKLLATQVGDLPFNLAPFSFCLGCAVASAQHAPDQVAVRTMHRKLRMAEAALTIALNGRDTLPMEIGGLFDLGHQH